MLETVFLKVWEAIFEPAFAAGALVGGTLIYYVINKGWINTPMLTKVKEELSEVRTELKHANEQIEEVKNQSRVMKAEFEDFVQWRKKLAEKALEDIEVPSGQS